MYIYVYIYIYICIHIYLYYMYIYIYMHINVNYVYVCLYIYTLHMHYIICRQLYICIIHMYPSMYLIYRVPYIHLYSVCIISWQTWWHLISWLHLTWADVPMKQTGQTGLGLTVFWCESRSDGSISSSADKSPCLHELILCNIAGLSTHRSMLHYATVSPCLLPLEKRNIRDKTKKIFKKMTMGGR
jgi:hypothetical protein